MYIFVRENIKMNKNNLGSIEDLCRDVKVLSDYMGLFYCLFLWSIK